MSRAASLPGAELFLRNRTFILKKSLVPGSFAAWGIFFSQNSDFFFEETTCPGQLRCLGQNFFLNIGLFVEQATCPGQLRCLGQIFVLKNVGNLKNALSGIMGLLCAERGVGNLNKCTFRNYGTPGRRTRRQKSQQRHVQEFWDSWAQNKTSEISTNALPGIMGLLDAEQDVEI